MKKALFAVTAVVMLVVAIIYVAVWLDGDFTSADISDEYYEEIESGINDNNYVDENYEDTDDTILSTPLDELGFYNLNNVELIGIAGAKDDYVYGARKSSQYSTNSGLKFLNSQIRVVQFNSLDDIRFEKGELLYITPYTVFDNDSISYGTSSFDNYTLEISERKILDKNRVIIVVSQGSKVDWYVPRDLLDCSEVESYSYTINRYEVNAEYGYKIPWKE